MFRPETTTQDQIVAVENMKIDIEPATRRNWATDSIPIILRKSGREESLTIGAQGTSTIIAGLVGPRAQGTITTTKADGLTTNVVVDSIPQQQGRSTQIKKLSRKRYASHTCFF